ncbi:MAG: hypothetical protein IKK34_14440 [Clostridia bacterium]|nr:hypothetical protein [Clostridia bacterium]
MAYMNGRKYTCDRCGSEAFCKCTGEGETDGGFTRWNEFEPLPEGWQTHFEVGMLCPMCNQEFNIFVTHFMGVKMDGGATDGKN